MKKIFKFAAMAFAAVALFASCDMLDNNQNDDQNQEPAALSVDGKQWSVDFMYGGMMEATLILDLGVTTENMVTIYVGGDAFGGIYPMMGGNYTVTPTDSTSGKIAIVDPSDPSAAELVFNYSDLTETSVKLTCAAEAFAMENAEAEAVEYNPEVE